MFPELRIARGKLIYRYSPNIFTFHFSLFVFSFPLLVVSFSYFSVKLVKVVKAALFGFQTGFHDLGDQLHSVEHYLRVIGIH